MMRWTAWANFNPREAPERLATLAYTADVTRWLFQSARSAGAPRDQS
jgi:hypothetical protein